MGVRVPPALAPTILYIRKFVMPKLKILITDTQHRQADAEDVLRNALKQDYDQVLVLGMKNNNVSIDISRQKSIIETLGMIEFIKNRLLTTW